MVHNEAVFLPLWIKHYSKVPGATLIVVDNGSDDGSTENLPPEIEKITFPHKERSRDTARIVAISDLQNALITYYDCVIYTDVDEFIVADPASGKTLTAILQARKANALSPIGLNIIQRQSLDSKIDFHKPILAQRQHVVFTSEYSKPIITFEKTRWMKGFHGARQWPCIAPDLYLFHLRLIDLDFSLERTRLRMERTIEGNIHGTWGRTEAAMTEFFMAQSNRPLAPQDENFEFGVLIGRAFNTIQYGADKLAKRLGHVDGAYLHQIPDRFLNQIEGLGR